MCAKKRVQNIFHHISITILWQWDDSEREENELFWKIGTSICTLFFFLTSHFHHIFMTIWWNHTFRNIFQNSFPYHCDENVMEQSSSTYLQKLSHHIFITFSSHIYDNEMMLKDHNFTDKLCSKLISLHLKYHQKVTKKVMKTWWPLFWIFSTWWLFHHIFIKMVWKWVLKNIAESMIPSNCHKNVMEMWCQEKKCKLKF